IDGTTPVLDERGRDWSREGIEAPTSLRDVLGHRLDQMSEADLALLAPAAVLGVAFEESLLRTVSGLEAPVLAAALERLRAARVRHRHAAGGGRPVLGRAGAARRGRRGRSGARPPRGGVPGSRPRLRAAGGLRARRDRPRAGGGARGGAAGGAGAAPPGRSA